MKKNNIKDIYNENDEMKNSLEEINSIPSNQNLLLNKNSSNLEFINKNNGKNLNLDYIPQELFMNFKNKKINENDEKEINNISSNIINNESSSKDIQNLKSQNVLESNHFNSLYFNDKNNELKTSKKTNNLNSNSKTNNFDFKISTNNFNLSESSNNNNEKNNIIHNIFNNQNPEQNIYLLKSNNIVATISKDSSSNLNRRYNQDLGYYNSFDINNNLNSNIISNTLSNNIISNNLNNIKSNNLNNNRFNDKTNNLLTSKSSLISNNNSTCNGYSDHYINSILNISNTLTNGSNYFLNSQNNINLAEKIKLRDVESKEKILFEMENQRNMKMNEIIEKQKDIYLKKEKEREEKEQKEREEKEKELEQENLKKIQQMKMIEKLADKSKNENLKENYNEKFFITKEKESWYDYNISSNRRNKEGSQINDINNDNENQNMNNKEINGNLDNNEKINNNNHNNIIEYFKKVKNEQNNNLNLNKYTYRTSLNNNYKTTTSFYIKKTPNISPFISSAITDNNINSSHIPKPKDNKRNNRNTIKSSKSIKNLSSSKISKTPSKLMKSLRSLEYNPTASLKMLNLLKNDNKYETYFNNEMTRYNKKNELNKIKYKKDINFKGKEKIQEKYNIYFNCFVPDLYEEQKEKLLNENKKYKMKKSKSETKIKISPLDDNIGPNLYNEQIDIPDFGYIAYKANKKINSNCSFNSINTLNSNYRNFNNKGNGNSQMNFYSNRNINTLNDNDIFTIHNNDNNNHLNNRNNSLLNLNENMNSQLKNIYFNNENNKSNLIMDNRGIRNERIYNEIYNKAFKQFNYKPNSYYEDYSNKNIKWYFNQ